jgi:hypothetical protein
MLDTCLFVLLSASDPPATEPPAVEPAPAQLPEPQLPEPQWEEQGLKVAKPGYDLGLDEVHVQKPNGTQYKLTAREWRDLVREDPELWRLHVRGRLMVPGIILTSVGGVWLSVSTAFAIDGYHDDSAITRLFQWGFPAAMLATGAAMTIVGVAARRRLHDARRRIYVGSYANRQGGGISLTGRF